LKTIDHDPTEPPRQTPGEAIFVTVVTVVVLVSLGLFLKWVAREGGLLVFGLTCVSILAICFAIAFRLEATKGRRL
jgi:uncharacterized membrane protein YkgB